MPGSAAGRAFAVLAAGFAGPALLLGSFAIRSGSGWDAPWYLAELRVVGYVPFVVMPLLVVWLAGTAQLAALAIRPLRAVSRRRTSCRRTGPLRRVVRAHGPRVARQPPPSTEPRPHRGAGGLSATGALRILGTLLAVAGA